MTDIQLSTKIKKLCNDRMITVKELCKMVEITESGLSKALKNNSLKIETLKRISDYFQIDISYFFSDVTPTGTSEKISELENEIMLLKDKTINLYSYKENYEIIIKNIKDRFTLTVFLLLCNLIKEENIKDFMTKSKILEMCYDFELKNKLLEIKSTIKKEEEKENVYSLDLVSFSKVTSKENGYLWALHEEIIKHLKLYKKV
jgi:transcriptional regulator with XRE-family HTH domain